ncbi:MAG: hypothetical protein GVY36_06735 [Verrucomicrobia bacterium]|jgi:hypothetical protein|nr:hypothetical protein [Verrucomicrobiota bacterium]
MKPTIRPFIIAVAVAAIGFTSVKAADTASFSTEARAIIENRMSEKALRESRRRAELDAVPAITRRVIQKENHQITINRVAPPAPKTAPAPISAERHQPSPLTRAEFEALMANQPEQQSISLSVTVFGDEYSKILWRKPRSAEENSDAPQEFEIWTNVTLKYLTPISSFERDGIVYNYFGFGERITREGEVRRGALAENRGYDYKSRWQEPPMDFTTGQSEYVVVNDGSRSIPAELYQQMDALFGHYLENEDRFKTAFQRGQALRKAREAYLKESPPEPKEVIINHWPISKGGAR